MKRGDHLQQAAAPLNNYQFDFGLPGMPKPSGSLKEQRAQSQSSTAQASAGWSASPGGWSSGSGSDAAFNFLGGGSVGGGSVGGGPKRDGGGDGISQKGYGVSSAYDFFGQSSPAGRGGGGGYYGSARPQVGNVSGVSSFTNQTGSQGIKGGADVSGNGWGLSTASKLASAGIPGYKPSSKEDVFGDLLGGALGGKSSAPLKQQQQQQNVAAGNGGSGMGRMGAAMPEVTMAPARETKGAAAKPAPFSYTAMFKSPSSFKPKAAATPMAEVRGGDPFADISFSKPEGIAPSSDPFAFMGKQQSAPPRGAHSASVPRSDPFGSSGGGEQLDSLFGIGSSSSASKAAQAHDGWGDVFGAAAEVQSFENEAATTELEGVGGAPVGVTGNSALEKGTCFYKEGQFPNAIKWFSWAVEVLEKEKGSKGAIVEVLTKRMSCFKEIGEMKKAIADCTKACELEPGSVELLMQRAHLYESCEKIKLGIADLREVMKIQPGHRVASQTLARLQKML
ncbi:uncharacterized protein [Physcomitrium patens]|uniref:Uncharacterized protein n=1 Tax=Physcomitrium patens TaxID=3218 RepID=A0A2K1KN45_PHYPA|nr:putative lysozyme-like protein [Physcomitrium patens]XP_024374281.1 putative lysozyme-like protein [Physcomitrium patens]PNR55202.1 hypothetical protein PHYPA_006097 [Physcomitrium patens]|eukprot:XP_024374280.1 putative lysozyme-like protein [Physcomitrella patens]